MENGGKHHYLTMLFCPFLHFTFLHIGDRIRLAIMQHVPHLAKQLGKEFFTEKLTSHCVGWLRDDISTIRQAAAENLKVCMTQFTSQSVYY